MFYLGGKKLCWNAAIWRTCGEKISFFFIICKYLWKNLEFVTNVFFINVKKKPFAKKSFSVFKGPPLSPLNTLWLFFCSMLKKKFNNHKKCIWYQFKNMHILKKKEVFDRKVFKLQHFSKKIPNARNKLNDKNVKISDKTKFLGTVITNDLKWEENTSLLVKKANARIQLLWTVATFARD